jgi:hypothetical protein
VCALNNVRVPRIASRSLIAFAILGAVGASATACSAVSTVSGCSPSPAPVAIASPIRSLATQLDAMSGVLSASTTFANPQTEACNTSNGSADNAWQSSIRVDMTKDASPTQVSDVASVAGQEVVGEVSLSIELPSSRGQASTLLTLTEGSDSGQHGRLAPILAAAKQIGSVPHVQQVVIDPGLEPAVPGSTSIVLGDPDNVQAALAAARKTILAYDTIDLSCGQRLELTTQAGQPSASVLDALVDISRAEPDARISNVLGSGGGSVFIETPTKTMASTVARKLSDASLASVPATKTSFTIVASNPTSTVKGWVGSGVSH